MHEPPTPHALALHRPGSPEAFDALVEDIRSVVEAIRVACRDLADFPDPEGERERALAGLLARRRELSADLGAAGVALISAGGRLSAAAVVVPELPVAPAPPAAPPVEGPKVEVAKVEPEPPQPPPVERLPERSPELPRRPVAEPRDIEPIRPRPIVVRPPTPPKPARPPRDLRGHLEAVGRPAPVPDPAAAETTVARLVDATADLDAWLVFPPEVQQALTGLVSSMARHIQDEMPFALTEQTAEQLRGLFPAMSYWSKLYRPGFVPGLSRRFGPERESWLEDAEHWWWLLSDQTSTGAPQDLVQRAIQGHRSRPPLPRRDDDDDDEDPVDPVEALKDVERVASQPTVGPELAEFVTRAVAAGVPQRDPRLLKALRPHKDLVGDIPGLKTLKTALREAQDAAEVTEEPNDTAPSVPDDWPFLSLTAEKRAVIVGGDRRTQSAERIKDAFRFASVDWEVKDARRLRALSERVRSGSIDLVILLRAFIGHGEQELVLDACRAASVRFVVVDSGYGVNQVRRAIERFGQPATEG